MAPLAGEVGQDKGRFAAEKKKIELRGIIDKKYESLAERLSGLESRLNSTRPGRIGYQKMVGIQTEGEGEDLLVHPLFKDESDGTISAAGGGGLSDVFPMKKESAEKMSINWGGKTGVLEYIPGKPGFGGSFLDRDGRISAGASESDFRYLIVDMHDMPNAGIEEMLRRMVAKGRLNEVEELQVLIALETGLSKPGILRQKKNQK
jgi:hypothetical protein